MSPKKAIPAKWVKQLRLTVLLGLLLVLLYLLVSGFGPDRQVIEGLLYTVKESALGLPTVIAVFLVLGLIGTPQFLLIGASIFVFGPVMGSAYSWAGTMVSACLHFWLGRWVGAESISKFSGERFGKIVGFVSKNGFWSALLVRVVPSGPFILVNLALGVSRSKFVQFAAGTGLGIIPKILALAFVGQGLVSWTQQTGISLILLFFGLAAAVFVVIWLLRRAWKRKQNQLD